MSLPTRERELKRSLVSASGHAPLSLPTRERELKLEMCGLVRGLNCRSLHGSVN